MGGQWSKIKSVFESLLSISFSLGKGSDPSPCNKSLNAQELQAPIRHFHFTVSSSGLEGSALVHALQTMGTQYSVDPSAISRQIIFFRGP